MAPKQQKHQEEYLIANRKYENAFEEKRRAENEVSNILNRRQQVISMINKLAAEMNRNSNFDSSVKDTESKLETASIGESSVGTLQNFTEVFDERNRYSKSSICGKSIKQVV